MNGTYRVSHPTVCLIPSLAVYTIQSAGFCNLYDRILNPNGSSHCRVTSFPREFHDSNVIAPKGQQAASSEYEIEKSWGNVI